MRTLKFTVPTIPVAQPRQRHTIVKSGKRQFVSNYTPKKDPVNTFKAAVQLAFNQAYQGPVIDCPVRMDMLYVFPRPRNKIWKTKQMPSYPHTIKPDRDNVEKAACDALNELLYKDDSRVFSGDIIKMVASENEKPHVVIKVSLYETEGDLERFRKYISRVFYDGIKMS